MSSNFIVPTIVIISSPSEIPFLLYRYINSCAYFFTSFLLSKMMLLRILVSGSTGMFFLSFLVVTVVLGALGALGVSINKLLPLKE